MPHGGYAGKLRERTGAGAKPGQKGSHPADPVGDICLHTHSSEFFVARLLRRMAEAGRLNTMVGATPEVFAALEPVLRAFCENVVHVGPPGAGHIVKLANNFIAMSIACATAEAGMTVRRMGVDPQKLVDVVSLGAINNGIFQGVLAQTLQGNFEALKFALDNARKDIRYYTHMAEALPMTSIMGEATHQSLVTACMLGYGQEYVPSLVKAQEKLNGTNL